MEKDKLNEHIDKILSALSESPGLEIEHLYATTTGRDTDTYNDFIIIKSVLKTEDLALENMDMALFYITPNGLKIVHSGGYLKHKKDIEKELSLKREKELLEIDQLKWSKNTRYIAWGAIAISLISLITQIVSMML